MIALGRALTLGALVIGGILYADWVFEFLLPIHVSLLTSFISELSASGQPYQDLFRSSDIICGSFLMVGGASAWAWTGRRPLVWGSLMALGLCVLVEAALPLSTAFADGVALPAAGTQLWWSTVSEPHGLASALESVAYLVLLVACARALRATGVARKVRWLLIGIGGIAALAGAIDAIQTLALLVKGDSTALGLVQRIDITLTAVWLAAAPTCLALAMMRQPRGALVSRASTDVKERVPTSDAGVEHAPQSSAGIHA